jgi:hypothetical protein
MSVELLREVSEIAEFSRETTRLLGPLQPHAMGRGRDLLLERDRRTGRSLTNGAAGAGPFQVTDLW